MGKNTELYEKYDLILPPKFDGGYLIIALYEKVKAKEINEHFTFAEIRYVLNEIRELYNESSTHPERLLKILLHYFLRNDTDEPGKYYLTDHAKYVVELMINKLENPYKNFPLKKSFDDSFTDRIKLIETASDLEEKFGRLFIEGPKKVIIDHLESFEDELLEAYDQLNIILQSDEKSATALVRNFVKVFRKFGDKAEDITNAINSKDKFLHNLQRFVDVLYSKIENFKPPVSENEVSDLEQLKEDWARSLEILSDIESFFISIDYKMSYIRRQITNASDKLSELHEQFSVRANLRLQIKRLFKIVLESAFYSEDGPVFKNNFPLKLIVNKIA